MHTGPTIPPATWSARWREYLAVWTREGPLLLCHVAFVVGVCVVPVGWADAAAVAGLMAARGLGVTLGYHRLLTHRSFRTTRVAQFLLAALGASTFQGGPLWWVGHHRRHHRHADTPNDVHSPHGGFWWSHWGWVFSPAVNRPPARYTRDLAALPELVWLDRFAHVPGLLMAAACYAAGGWAGLLVWFAGSTVLMLHATLSVNSVAHLVGSRRFDTRDDSRNNFWVAFLTLGEGWHNNHHAWPVSARHGFVWHELDATYWFVLALERAGLIWAVKRPPAVREEAGLSRK